jgi:hypothetical protein
MVAMQHHRLMVLHDGVWSPFPLKVSDRESPLTLWFERETDERPSQDGDSSVGSRAYKGEADLAIH